MTLTPAMFIFLTVPAVIVILLITVVIYLFFSINRIAFCAVVVLASESTLPRGIFCEKMAEALPRRQNFLFVLLGSIMLKQLTKSGLVEESANGIHITYRGLIASDDYKTFCKIYGS